MIIEDKLRNISSTLDDNFWLGPVTGLRELEEMCQLIDDTISLQLHKEWVFVGLMQNDVLIAIET